MKFKVKKIITVILAAVFILSLVLSVTACKDNETGGDKGSGEDKSDGLDFSTDTDIKVTDPMTSGWYISGYVRNMDFELMKDIGIYFGDDKELAAVTDADGKFNFNYSAPYGIDYSRILDAISISGDYKFRAVGTDFNYSHFGIVILTDDKDSDTDFYYGITSFFVKTTFNQDNIILPPGYVSRDIVYDNGGFSQNGETTLTGIDVFIDGKYYGTTDIYGITFEFIKTNSVIEFKKDGFIFVNRTNGYKPLEDCKYIVPPVFDLEFLEIQGKTEPFNPNVLIGGK